MAQLTHPGLHVHDHDWPLRPPGAVRAVATIGAVLAGIGIVTAPFVALPLVSGTQQPMETHGGVQAAWMVMSALLSVALSVYLLIASVAALGMRRWSRMGMIVFGVAALVTAAIFTYPYLRWMGIIGDTAAAARGPAAFVNLFGWLFSIPYAVLVLVVMTRPRVRGAFDAPPSEAP